MKNRNYISYLLILVGGCIAVYANANEKQNIILLVLGIVFLMRGIFILNKNLISKPQKKEYEIKEEEE